ACRSARGVPSKVGPGRPFLAWPLRMPIGSDHAGAPVASPASSRNTGAAEWGASFLERALGLLVAALPFGVALSRAGWAGQWRDDLPAVRDLGLVSVGVGGGLSTIAAQAMSLVPLGGRTFRAAVGSALALGVAAWLTYRLALRVLRAAAPLAAGE